MGALAYSEWIDIIDRPKLPDLKYYLPLLMMSVTFIYLFINKNDR